MRRESLLTMVGGAALLLLLWAGPASGHARFAGAGTYPSDTDQQLTLRVPDERGSDVHNTGVSVFIPAEWSPLACTTKPTWSCQVIPAAGSQRAEIRWTNDSGTPPGPDDETFAFTIHTGPPGKVAFPVTQTYSNGEVARWIDDASGADKPAPVLEAVATGVTSGSSTTSASSATTATVAPTATTDEGTGASPAGGDDGGVSPLVVIALVVALAGLAGGGIWLVRRR